MVREVFEGGLAGEQRTIVPSDDAGGRVEEAFATEKFCLAPVGTNAAAV